MKASPDNHDCLPRGLIFYLAGFTLSKRCVGAGTLPQEKSTEVQGEPAALRPFGQRRGAQYPFPCILASDTKGGDQELLLRIRHKLAKLN